MASTRNKNGKKVEGRWGCALNWALDHTLHGVRGTYPDGAPLQTWAELRNREWVECHCDEDDCDGYCAQPKGQGCKCCRAQRGLSPLTATAPEPAEEKPAVLVVPVAELETPEKVTF